MFCEPPPARPRYHFQPANLRRLRLKRMVKCRHKPISKSEISTIAHHRSQQKVGSPQRLPRNHPQYWTISRGIWMSRAWISPINMSCLLGRIDATSAEPGRPAIGSDMLVFRDRRRYRPIHFTRPKRHHHDGPTKRPEPAPCGPRVVPATCAYQTGAVLAILASFRVRLDFMSPSYAYLACSASIRLSTASRTASFACSTDAMA